MKQIKTAVEVQDCKYGRDLCTTILTKIINLHDCLNELDDRDGIDKLDNIRKDIKNIRSRLTEPIEKELTKNA